MSESHSRGSGRKKKESGIPIPSFSCVSPSTAKSNEATVVVPNWNKSWLSKAEGALCVQRIRRGPSRWSPEGLLRLDDFYSLARQLSLVETSKDAVSDPDGLSLPERLLCDLVCALSPSLYELVRDEDNIWCLKIVDYRGNRMEELRRLVSSTELDVAKRDGILQSIKEHRSLSEKKGLSKKVTAANSDEKENSTLPQKVILEPFIRADMTLEDRVRARAEAKQQREADLSSNMKDEKPDYSSLLRLADAMWSHSRHTLRRQARISKRPPARFCMTVKDVVWLFAGSLATSSRRGVSMEQLYREKATRVEMLQALRDLQRLVPEWISFSSPNLSKGTTVWLSPTADIASVRTKLGAPKSIHTKGTLTPRVLRKEMVLAGVSLSPLTGESSMNDDATFSPTNLASPRKRTSEDSLLSPLPKKKKGLGINKHLVLTDADDDGKMLLQPRSDEGPPGLKRMFAQTNSGQRI